MPHLFRSLQPLHVEPRYHEPNGNVGDAYRAPLGFKAVLLWSLGLPVVPPKVGTCAMNIHEDVGMSET